MAIKDQANQGNNNLVTILAEDIPMGIKSSEAETNQEQSRSVEGEYQRAVENIRAEIRQYLTNREITVSFTVSFTGTGLVSSPSYREISRIVDEYVPEHHALVTSILQEEYNNHVTSLILQKQEKIHDDIGRVVAATAIAEVRYNFHTAGITNMEVRPWIVTKCSEVLAPVLTDRGLSEQKQKDLMEASVKAANRCFQRIFQRRMILCADFQHELY